MIERDHIGNDAREAEHRRRLGPGSHVCLFCGVTDPPEWLIAKTAQWLKARVPRSVLEEHHVFLEILDAEFIVLLCIRCHFKVSQAYFSAGIDFRLEPNPRKRVALMLKALAVFFELLAETVREWATLLEIEGESQ